METRKNKFRTGILAHRKLEENYNGSQSSLAENDILGFCNT